MSPGDVSRGGVRPPVRVALAESVGTLPRGRGLAYEPKFDGHRVVIFRYGDEVVLQARSGRIITAAFPDLVDAARRLPDGTVLDGEVVVWTDGRTDFAAVQGRAAATRARAEVLAVRLPASYAAFDLLAEEGKDLRPVRYERRRERLVAVLGPLGPPLQPVPMTPDPELAEVWYETLPAIGVEGLVIKRLDQPYRGGTRSWRKLRHTDTRDALVVGYTGGRDRPTALALVLPDDDLPIISSPLAPALRVQAGEALAVASASRGAAAEATASDARPGAAAGPGAGATAMAPGLGEVAYQPVRAGLMAEVAQGTTRHSLITVLRLRDDPRADESAAASATGTDPARPGADGDDNDGDDNGGDGRDGGSDG